MSAPPPPPRPALTVRLLDTAAVRITDLRDRQQAFRLIERALGWFGADADDRSLCEHDLARDARDDWFAIEFKATQGAPAASADAALFDALSRVAGAALRDIVATYDRTDALCNGRLTTRLRVELWRASALTADERRCRPASPERRRYDVRFAEQLRRVPAADVPATWRDDVPVLTAVVEEACASMRRLPDVQTELRYGEAGYTLALVQADSMSHALVRRLRAAHGARIADVRLTCVDGDPLVPELRVRVAPLTVAPEPRAKRARKTEDAHRGDTDDEGHQPERKRRA